MQIEWQTAKTYEDILYHKSGGTAKITINRPHKRNAFRPKTVQELCEAFTDAREDTKIGVVLFTGAGPHTDGKYAFCAGGDQSVRGAAGYVDEGGIPRLNVLGNCFSCRLRNWRRSRSALNLRLDDRC